MLMRRRGAAKNRVNNSSRKAKISEYYDTFFIRGQRKLKYSNIQHKWITLALLFTVKPNLL